MKVLLVLAASLALAAAGTADFNLLDKIQRKTVTEVIIELPQIADQVEKNAAFQAMEYDDDRVAALVSMLKGLTSAAQAPYVARLKKLGMEYETFYASNIILVKQVTVEAVQELLKIEGDFKIREEVWVSIYPGTVVEHNDTLPSPPQTVQWGISNIRCNAVWSRSQGEGTVAGIVDTGVNQGHTALSAGYAGAWRDPYYSTAGPTDQHGHGSHCAGTILGRANGVGCAPGARWIACRGLNHQGSGSESALTTCAQFFVSANPRPTVSSNSWGGGGGSTWYNSQISAYQNAGIIPVFAIGNSGSACRTAGSPGDQPNLISVGSTTNTNAMSSFSSRGPSSSGVLKPELSAPGSNIVSCGTGASNYATMSGTSMATPHVAGAVCLIKSVNSGWTYTQVSNALRNSAAQPTLTAADRACGLVTPGQDFPNCAFGYGRIDVGRALGL